MACCVNKIQNPSSNIKILKNKTKIASIHGEYLSLPKVLLLNLAWLCQRENGHFMDDYIAMTLALLTLDIW